MQNDHVEGFNGRFRDKYLKANWFPDLADARHNIGSRHNESNCERSHSSMGYRTPNEFAAILKSSVMSGC